jgi:hypothetical protein
MIKVGAAEVMFAGTIEMSVKLNMDPAGRLNSTAVPSGFMDEKGCDCPGG